MHQFVGKYVFVYKLRIWGLHELLDEKRPYRSSQIQKLNIVVSYPGCISCPQMINP